MSTGPAVFSACLLSLALAVAPPVPAWQDRPRDLLRDGSYFPLQIGNQWLYRVIDPAGEPTSRLVSVTEEITGTDGLPLFTLEGYFGPKRLVHSLRNGTVVESGPGDGPDYLWYLLKAPVGARWILSLSEPSPSCVNGASVRVASRSDTVKVPAGEFRNAVRLEYSTPCMDAGIQTEWFAPGVGLIKRLEIHFIGLQSMELLAFNLGNQFLPPPANGASLFLDRSLYYQNLMPSTDPDPSGIAVVDAAFVLSNRTDFPVESIFGGCRSATFSVIDPEGKELIRVRGDDGGCCACASTQSFLLRGSFMLRAKIRLELEDGTPLPSGQYAVAATLDAVNLAPPLRPSARVPIEVVTVY